MFIKGETMPDEELEEFKKEDGGVPKAPLYSYESDQQKVYDDCTGFVKNLLDNNQQHITEDPTKLKKEQRLHKLYFMAKNFTEDEVSICMEAFIKAGWTDIILFEISCHMHDLENYADEVSSHTNPKEDIYERPE